MLGSKERYVIEQAINKLQGRDRLTSPEVLELLEDNPVLRVWLNTWVVKPLRIIATAGRTRQDLDAAVDLSD